MKKTLTTVGNSKALIIPAELVKKYGLDVVEIREIEGGILISPCTNSNDFRDELEKLRLYKKDVYQKMASEAKEPEVQAYYSKPENNLSDVDPDIVE